MNRKPYIKPHTQFVRMAETTFIAAGSAYTEDVYGKETDFDVADEGDIDNLWNIDILDVDDE